ncbi:XRE family transcriptional regulator [Undibacterium sp. 5I1]|uniref:XRE family transcriptional regulator n=1 Tax=unclassified Undibacterium TaxID=2630295 RepID=UPI002AB32C79|nr:MULTISPECIES: XRE family transcriptional regulator [unclassified Undibacterium]MDY7539800.1 XRE family transcriptional regulator [Undibacterium sp. 5I1]MEB0232056.1 XRE family transcriptional regulator [Undibacterium sp. 10I3]MEB0256836.1 XRE family transcriptional regulator [Undibacterium sp. 5I1]
MDNKKEKFAGRLAEAMRAQGYNAEPAVLEREFNLRHYGEPMTLHGVRKWLIGASIPPYEKIITLATWLNVPPDDLTFGLEVKQKIKQKNANWKEAISYNERETFEAFLNLPAPQRKIVREVILAFAAAYPVSS